MDECASFWDWSEEVKLLQQALRTDSDFPHELKVSAPPNSPSNEVLKEDQSTKSEALRQSQSDLEGLNSETEREATVETEGATFVEGEGAVKLLITEGGAPSEKVEGSGNQVSCEGGSGALDSDRSGVLNTAASERAWEAEVASNSLGCDFGQTSLEQEEDRLLDSDQALHLNISRLHQGGEHPTVSDGEVHSCASQSSSHPPQNQRSSPHVIIPPSLLSPKSPKTAPRRPRQLRRTLFGRPETAVRPVLMSFGCQDNVVRPGLTSLGRQDNLVQPVLMSVGRQDTAVQKKQARVKTHFRRSHPLLDITATDWLQYSPATFTITEDSVSDSKEECIHTLKKHQSECREECIHTIERHQSENQNPSKLERSPVESVGQSSLAKSADSSSNAHLELAPQDLEPDAFSFKHSPSDSSLDGSFRYEERQALESPLSSRASSSSNLEEGEASSDSCVDMSDSHLYLQCNPLPPSDCNISPASTPPPANNSDDPRTFKLPPHVSDPAEAEELEQLWAASLRARRAEHGDQHYFTAAELMSPPWNKLVFWHGCDKKRQPVLYCRLGLAVRTLPRHMQERMGCALYSMVELAENSLWRPECGWGFQRMTVIVDADGLGITRMAPVEALKHGFKLIHRDYPARQGHTYIINVPPLLNIVIGIFKRAIGYNEIEASERLSVCGRNYRARLQEAFEPEMLHADFGGSCSCCSQSKGEDEKSKAGMLSKVPLKQKRLCRPEDWLLDTVAPHQL